MIATRPVWIRALESSRTLSTIPDSSRPCHSEPTSTFERRWTRCAQCCLTLPSMTTSQEQGDCSSGRGRREVEMNRAASSGQGWHFALWLRRRWSAIIAISSSGTPGLCLCTRLSRDVDQITKALDNSISRFEPRSLRYCLRRRPCSLQPRAPSLPCSGRGSPAEYREFDRRQASRSSRRCTA